MSTNILSKRGQIEMGEHVIVLFIFFILLIFAVVFFSRIQSIKTEKKVGVDIETRALQIAQRVLFLPELQCTRANAEVFPNCYDEHSAKSVGLLAKSGQNTEYYRAAFGYSVITIKKIFPVQEEEIVIYNDTKPDFRSITPTNVPITLCDFTSELAKEDCSFAVLTVSVYD
jgi:hypothetical protein